MDEQRFEYLAKTLANSTSRRTAIRAIAGSAGASLFALFGLGSTTIAARRLQITKQPEVTFDGFQAIVTWVTDQPADGVVEYGTTARPDQKVLSEEVTTDHRVVLPDLEPDTRYYFRVRSTGEGGTVRSARLRFKTPN
jgi:phosphodiesterase/alkaline phosphatase D-like protein